MGNLVKGFKNVGLFKKSLYVRSFVAYFFFAFIGLLYFDKSILKFRGGI